MANHLTFIVRAATAGDAGVRWVSALPCARRPARRPCQGNLAVSRTDVPPSISWRCTSCGDEGVISGWERSPFDLRLRSDDPRDVDPRRVLIRTDHAATLRTILFSDTSGERLVFGASVSDNGVVLVGDEDAFDDLVDSVAAEANHEQDRRRRKRLDEVSEMLSDPLRTPRR